MPKTLKIYLVNNTPSNHQTSSVQINHCKTNNRTNEVQLKLFFQKKQYSQVMQ